MTNEQPKLCPEKENDEEVIEKTIETDKSSWAEDQRRHDYYYDDAHGYEIYNPDQDDDEEENEENEQ